MYQQNNITTYHMTSGPCATGVTLFVYQYNLGLEGTFLYVPDITYLIMIDNQMSLLVWKPAAPFSMTNNCPFWYENQQPLFVWKPAALFSMKNQQSLLVWKPAALFSMTWLILTVYYTVR